MFFPLLPLLPLLLLTPSTRMTKILITGASGFIGGFLTEEAIGKGYEIWAGVRKSSSREYLTDPGIRFIDLNYSDPDVLQRQLAEHVALYGKWEYIIHNAGITKCIDKKDFDRINYQHTVHFVDALQQSDAVPEKFILMSSLSAEYPDTAYGRSKRKAEQYLLSLPDFPSVILRPTGVYGPREKDYALMIRSIQWGIDVKAGLKPQLLTFIYVKDLVSIVFLALESSITHQIYPVADGDVYTDLEYTELIRKELKKKWVLSIRIPLWLLYIVSFCSEKISFLTGKPATLNTDKYYIMKRRNWECDVSILLKNLKFTPKYNLEKGLRETIVWYKSDSI